MGINIQILKLLLEENNYSPLYGDILLIGRSTVTISDIRIRELLQKYGIDASKLLCTQKKNKTRHASEGFHIDDVKLFECLSDSINSITVLDISDYEGASITVDLNYPIPKKLYNKFDFIFDSSVLDNIFNPAQGIVNISNFLKSQGRVLHLHHSSFFPGSMVACNPEWFYSFYACNKFLDVKLYLAEQNSIGWNRFEFETTLYKYKSSFTYNEYYDRFKAATGKSSVYYSLLLAEADEDWVDREITFPSNLQYISSSNEPNWTIREDKFNASPRPILGKKRLGNDVRDIATLPLSTDHFEFLTDKF